MTPHQELKKCADCGYREWRHDQSADSALAQVCYEYKSIEDLPVCKEGCMKIKMFKSELDELTLLANETDRLARDVLP